MEPILIAHGTEKSINAMSPQTLANAEQALLAQGLLQSAMLEHVLNVLLKATAVPIRFAIHSILANNAMSMQIVFRIMLHLMPIDALLENASV